jgi:hypothetical protein
MSLVDIILLMVNLVKTSIQIALDRFFETKGSGISMTQQSFSEARDKLRWEAIRFLFDEMLENIYTRGFDTWHSFRVMAIDGTKQQLPSDGKLREKFGTAGRGDTSVTAQASCLYDVYNDLIIDARIGPMEFGERSQALQHIERLRELSSFRKELIIFDRGYASNELIESLIEGPKPIYFLMRIKKKFNKAIDKLGIGDHNFRLNGYHLRVIKFELDTGEVETLLTNLTDPDLSLQDFKQLYFKRWPVETKYYQLKHKMEIENFSGRTENAIYQDFYVTALLSNIVAVAIGEAQPVIDAGQEGKENKYEYSVNVNQAIGTFKDSYIKALMIMNPIIRNIKLTSIVMRLVRNTVPVRPNRSIKRNPNPRKSNFHHNRKSNC